MTEEQRSYELPDRSIIQVDHKVRYGATELLFNPEVGGFKGKSIPEMIKESIGLCPVHMQDVYIR